LPIPIKEFVMDSTHSVSGHLATPTRLSHRAFRAATRLLAAVLTSVLPAIAVAQVLSFSPPSVNFPPQTVATTSAPQTVTVTNTGGALASVVSIVPVGDFSAYHNCPASLAPTAFCTLTITFTPTSLGPRSGSVTITGTNGPWVLALSGTGGSGAPTFVGPFAYITHFNSNYVTVLDVATNQVVKTLIVGQSPEAVAVAPNGGAVYVGNYLGDTLSIIDTSTQTVSGTIAVGDGPRGVAVSPDSSRVYVANNAASTVSVVNAIAGTVIATIPVGATPWGVAVSPDGTRAYVANGGSGSLSVINTFNNTVAVTIPVGNLPYGVAISPDGARVYVANFGSNSVSVVSTATNTVIATVFVDSGPFGLALSPDGTRLWVTTNQNTVSAIDTASNTKFASIPVGNHPLGIAVTPDGTRAYVANYGDGMISVINLGTLVATNAVQLANGPAAFGNFLSPGYATGTAVEYYAAVFDHYFITAFPAEQAALDGGAFGGAWVRTGRTFKVWTQPIPSSSPVCRFFSTAFGLKSSHFYTPFASECALVKTYPQWQYEAIAFHMQIPVGFGTANGDCPIGTDRLYRLYNNGMGGAPNHRYTTNVAIFNQMVAAGWVFEGEANTRVFSCVPR
jgi:YVTN family beta-propeller protein